MHTLELRNPKELIRSSQAETTKGKTVIIGNERPEKKTPQVAAKTLGGQGKKKKTGSTSTGLTGSKTSLTGDQTGLNGASSGLGNSSKAKSRARPNFKELLTKYEEKGASQQQKGQSSKGKGTRTSSRHQEQSDSSLHQGNRVVMPHSFDWPVAP